MKNKIITISREFGSGGRTIGKQLAKKLDIPYYDADIIQLTARESGMAEPFIRTQEEAAEQPVNNCGAGAEYQAEYQILNVIVAGVGRGSCSRQYADQFLLRPGSVRNGHTGPPLADPEKGNF